MSSLKIAQVSGAVLISAAAIAWAILWHDYPGSVPGPCANYPGPGIADCEYLPPLGDRILKWAVGMAALIGLAVFVSFRVSRPVAFKTAAACGLSALLATVPLPFAMYDAFAEIHAPDHLALLAIGLVGGLIGAAVAWCTSRWWPNTSLERTRDR